MTWVSQAPPTGGVTSRWATFWNNSGWGRALPLRWEMESSSPFLQFHSAVFSLWCLIPSIDSRNTIYPQGGRSQSTKWDRKLHQRIKWRINAKACTIVTVWDPLVMFSACSVKFHPVSTCWSRTRCVGWWTLSFSGIVCFFWGDAMEAACGAMRKGRRNVWWLVPCMVKWLKCPLVVKQHRITLMIRNMCPLM